MAKTPERRLIPRHGMFCSHCVFLGSMFFHGRERWLLVSKGKYRLIIFLCFPFYPKACGKFISMLSNCQWNLPFALPAPISQAAEAERRNPHISPGSLCTAKEPNQQDLLTSYRAARGFARTHHSPIRCPAEPQTPAQTAGLPPQSRPEWAQMRRRLMSSLLTPVLALLSDKA